MIVSFIGFTEEQENNLRQNKNIRNIYVCDFPGRFLSDFDTQMSEQWLSENKSILEKLRNDFYDEESKMSLDRFIHQKSTGIYRKEYSKKPQYFDDDIIHFGENETFVDCGAFDGDTVMQFIDTLKNAGISNYKKIFAFEADQKNVLKIEKNLAGKQNIQLIAKGVSDKTETLRFSSDGTMSSAIRSGGDAEIDVVPIDEALNGEEATFIKMDIEGSELKALMGAKGTIKRCKPKLAICVYHRLEDLITIPQYIQSLVPDYKLYFRNYCEEAQDAVIYAL